MLYHRSRSPSIGHSTGHGIANTWQCVLCNATQGDVHGHATSRPCRDMQSHVLSRALTIPHTTSCLYNAALRFAVMPHHVQGYHVDRSVRINVLKDVAKPSWRRAIAVAIHLALRRGVRASASVLVAAPAFLLEGPTQPPISIPQPAIESVAWCAWVWRCRNSLTGRILRVCQRPEETNEEGDDWDKE